MNQIIQLFDIRLEIQDSLFKLVHSITYPTFDSIYIHCFYFFEMLIVLIDSAHLAYQSFILFAEMTDNHLFMSFALNLNNFIVFLELSELTIIDLHR